MPKKSSSSAGVFCAKTESPQMHWYMCGFQPLFCCIGVSAKRLSHFPSHLYTSWTWQSCQPIDFMVLYSRLEFQLIDNSIQHCFQGVLLKDIFTFKQPHVELSGLFKKAGKLASKCPCYWSSPPPHAQQIEKEAAAFHNKTFLLWPTSVATIQALNLWFQEF